MYNIDKMKCESPDFIQANIEKLAGLFPSVLMEARDENGSLKKAVNFDLLRQLLSQDVLEGDENYEFTWPGKKQAIVDAGRPIRKTLRPCPEESTKWDDTENLYIEGDNLDVLKLLQDNYLGKVKMIYIDPPYNTGNDFIYHDSFAVGRQEYKEHRGEVVKNEVGVKQRLLKNTDVNGRFHSDWCSMIYPRLMMSRNLLSEDGVIFISCDDNEVARLRNILDEIYGEANFVAQLIWKSKSGGANDSKFFATDHEYIIAYAKNIKCVKIYDDTEASISTNYNFKDEHGEYALDRLDKQSIRYSKSLDYPITGPDGRTYYPQHKDRQHPNATWRWSKETVKERYGELVFHNGNVYTKNYKKAGSIPRSLLLAERFGRTRTGKSDNFELFKINLFPNPKPYKLIRYLLKILTREDDIILDFFSGSASTAHAVMQLNAEDGGKRQFIMVQLPEECDPDSEAAKAGYRNICEIGKERIRRAGEKIIQDNAGKEGIEDLDIGFRVLKCDSSNMKDVYYTAKDTSQADLERLINNIKEDRTDLDLLFGCILDLGLPLSLPYKSEKICGHDFHFYDYMKKTGDPSSLIACFDANISGDAIREIVRYKPLMAVFWDSSFASSQEMINAGELFKSHAPDTVLKII